MSDELNVLTGVLAIEFLGAAAVELRKLRFEVFAFQGWAVRTHDEVDFGPLTLDERRI